MRRGQGGMMLYEVMASLAVMGVVLNLCALAFTQSTRLNSYLGNRLDEDRILREVNADFRASVRASAGTVPGIGEHRNSADKLVLRSGPDTYTVWGTLAHAERLSRLEVTCDRDDPCAATAYATYPLPIRDVHFATGDGPVSLSFIIAAEDRRPADPLRHNLRVWPRLGAREATP